MATIDEITTVKPLYRITTECPFCQAATGGVQLAVMIESPSGTAHLECLHCGSQSALPIYEARRMKVLDATP